MVRIFPVRRQRSRFILAKNQLPVARRMTHQLRKKLRRLERIEMNITDPKKHSVRRWPKPANATLRRDGLAQATTAIVMMIAIAPSLNAPIRSLPVFVIR